MAKKSKKMTRKEIAREVAALKAEVANLKAEMALKAELVALKTELAHFRTEQKVKLKAEIDNLNKKIHAELEARKAVAGAKREEKKIKGKVHALEDKAAKAKVEAKAAIDARMTNIRNETKKIVTGVEHPQESKPGS